MIRDELNRPELRSRSLRSALQFGMGKWRPRRLNALLERAQRVWVAIAFQPLDAHELARQRARAVREVMLAAFLTRDGVVLRASEPAVGGFRSVAKTPY